MFFRFSLGLVLIGTGIASPWLVQDWLATHPPERRGGAFFEKAVEVRREWIHSALNGWGSGNPAPPAETVPKEIGKPQGLASNRDEAEASPGTYPLASTTSRVLKGLFPGNGGGRSQFGSTKSAATSFSQSVVEETGEKIDEEMLRMGISRGSPLFIRIFKEERELEVWLKSREGSHFQLFKIYQLRDLSGRLGPKLREGDGQSPEGFYFVSSSRMRPGTRHHLGIDLGFPNEFDKSLGRTGGEILIHGGTDSKGSFVLSPEHMNEVFTLADASLRTGQRFFRVHIFPFRMTDQRMEKEWARQPEWIKFWSNLKEGYDFFENTQFPPSVQKKEKEYLFRIP